VGGELPAGPIPGWQLGAVSAPDPEGRLRCPVRKVPEVRRQPARDPTDGPVDPGRQSLPGLPHDLDQFAQLGGRRDDDGPRPARERSEETNGQTGGAP